MLVVADEIHCELTYDGHDYTPFASLSEEFLRHSVTCNSPSKAFNLAGMQIANIVAADEGVRRRIDRAVNDNEVCDVNPLGVAALTAAYNEGAEWLDALRAYLRENYRFLRGISRNTCRNTPSCRSKAPIWHGSTAGPPVRVRNGLRNGCSIRDG